MLWLLSKRGNGYWNKCIYIVEKVKNLIMLDFFERLLEGNELRLDVKNYVIINELLWLCEES